VIVGVGFGSVRIVSVFLMNVGLLSLLRFVVFLCWRDEVCFFPFIYFFRFLVR